MSITIEQRKARQLVGFRLTGPWENTVAEGFTQLVAWTQKHEISGDWMAVYYGNPNVTPANELMVETVIGVPDGFVLPAESSEAQLFTLPAGHYAVQQVHVSGTDFAKPWIDFFQQLPATGYVPTGGPCFDHYLNDGTETQEWDILMAVQVQKA
ncbi:DNA gyrase inhibitor SbmC [Enterobacterales bacterium CwR94]|nr:DNA gyrase inhibitor SbmC [Enterobacterales bacterium CwR94]